MEETLKMYNEQVVIRPRANLSDNEDNLPYSQIQKELFNCDS